MIVFGGGANDVWALSLAGSPAWSQLAPAGTPPSPRSGHTAIYDPVRDRMVIFGGNSPSGDRNDVWALSLAGSPPWTPLPPAGTPPPPRSGPAAIYDPLRDRMTVFGGVLDGFRFNDVWVLSLAGSPTWIPLAPGGTLPPTLSGHTAIYDLPRDRMVVFGGSSNSSTALPEDVWALSLAAPAWSHPIPAGTPAYGPIGHAAIYDPLRDRMLVFGGVDWGAVYHNQAMALVWGTPVSVSAGEPGRLRLGAPRRRPGSGQGAPRPPRRTARGRGAAPRGGAHPPAAAGSRRPARAGHRDGRRAGRRPCPRR